MKLISKEKSLIWEFYFNFNKKVEVINIIQPTIKVLVAPAPTNARTISKVEIGAAKIS